MVTQQPAVYAFGEFILDVGRRRLSRHADSRAVPLSPKAVDALVYLVEHRHEVLDKDTLLAALWAGTVVEENSLTQTISMLRRALGDARGENRYIATVPRRGYRFVAEVVKRSDATQRTLAVLPFSPLVPEDCNESLGLGMAETLITRLNALHDMSVCPLSSVRRYATPDRDPLVAGRELGVEAVLDGSLQHHHGRLRVAVGLISATDGRQIWSASFDEDFTDVFDVQDAIAAKVAQALPLDLSRTALQRLVARDTRSAEAYRLYASGRYAWSRLTEAALEQSIAYFQEAIRCDATFARAYAGLSDCYATLAVFQHRAPRSVFPQAREAARKALELDPRLADAYVAAGHVMAQYDHDWAGAAREYARAVELDPKCTLGHLYQAVLLGYQGEFDRALAEARLAQHLEPMWPAPKACIGMLLYYARRYSESIAELEQTLDVDEHWDMARAFLGRACLRSHRPDHALAHFRACRAPTPGSTSDLASALAALGRRVDALGELARLNRLAEERYVSAYDFAVIEASLGDTEAALHSLERAIEERSTLIGWLPHDPAFDALKGNAAFARLAGRTGPTPHS
jgi:DNA-binding winged helix-turn-helix (wHTH) protein/tetratricopeptide (TPR) repeat protein